MTRPAGPAPTMMTAVVSTPTGQIFAPPTPPSSRAAVEGYRAHHDRPLGPARGRGPGLPGDGPRRTGRGRARPRQPARGAGASAAALPRTRGAGAALHRARRRPHRRPRRPRSRTAANASATPRPARRRSTSRPCAATPGPVRSCTPTPRLSSSPGWPSSRSCPLFGSYDIPAARLAAGGIPVYPRSVLLRRAELAVEMLDVDGRPAGVPAPRPRPGRGRGRGRGGRAAGRGRRSPVPHRPGGSRSRAEPWPPSPATTWPSCPTSATR